MYDPSGLTFLPNKQSVPLVVDHDLDRQVGVVHALGRWEWTDGPWIVARCSIAEPPPWLKRGTRASFGSRRLHAYEFNGWEHVRRALVDEVTIVGPGFQPVEPCAEVVLLEPASGANGSSTVGRLFDRHPAVGEIIHHPPGTLVRRENIGQVLGIR
jgi:hypothetical protein